MAGEISARDLVQQVWDEVAAEQALRPRPDAHLGDYERLVENSERHYVNSRYVLDRAPADLQGPANASPGGAKRKARARAAQFVVGVLRRYFEDEQEFLAHLVRLQNAMTVHIDRLSGEIRQLEALLQAESDRLRAADTALHGRLEDRIQALENDVAALRSQNGGARR